MVRGGVIERLDVIIDGDRDRARGAWNVAADHEHNTKFAESVREGECEAGDQPGDRERQDHASEGLPIGGAERSGSSQEFAVYGGERCGEGLHRKRKAIDDGADDEPFKGEGERVSGNALPPAAERALCAERDEQVEAQDGWRENEGKRDDSFDKKLPAAARECDPVGEREPEGKQGDGNNQRQAKRQD